IQKICEEGERSRPDPVGIAYGPPQPIGDCEILAWDMESQLARRIPGREERRYRMPHLAKFVPSKTVTRPTAYLVDQRQEEAVAKLEQHGITIERLSAARTFEADVYLLETVSKLDSTDVGSMTRKETVVSVSRRSGKLEARAGDVLVR